MADTHDVVRKGDRYLAYLLRMWRKNGTSTHWLASLESPCSSQRIGFPGLDELFEYLRQTTGEQMIPIGEGGEEGEEKRVSKIMVIHNDSEF